MPRRPGRDVRAHGFPWPEGGIEGVRHLDDPSAVLAGAQFALFPIPGIAANGALFAPAAPAPIIPAREMLAGMAAPAHIILGWADKNLKAHADALGIAIHEYEWDRALMLRRTPAIIEGLLKNRDREHGHHHPWLHASAWSARAPSARCSRAISWRSARTLMWWRAIPSSGRRRSWRARAPHTLDELPALAHRLDMLFSTVPSRVVGADILERLPKSALLVDLAAPPGGVDFEAAKRLGLKAIWGRGLGSRAPVTVGASQWSGIRARIEAILAAPD